MGYDQTQQQPQQQGYQSHDQQPVYTSPPQHQQQQIYHDPHQQVYQQPQQSQQPHQPHQQAYHEPQTQVYAQGPNVQNQEWQNGICSCSPCSSCLLATFLPCMIFGRTTSRLRDPSMNTHEEVNGDCGLWCAINTFTGCAWIFTLMKRGEIRERYGIKGSGCSDCCTVYWCSCCALIQQDNEVKARAARGPITQGYQSQKEGMHVPAQQQQPPAYPHA